MVKPSSENGSVPPFLKKCYDMVDDPSTDSIISWSDSNSNSNSNSSSRGRSDSFVIWDIPHFSERILPMYFKHNNFSSFIRQLNIYGFRKIDADRCEFANDKFVRGQKHLLKNIPRRKHPHISDQRKALQQQDKHNEPSQEAANHGLWNEVENLKSDKNSLMQELVKLKQHQESAENKLLLLHDRLQGMEKHQQQMLSFLVMVVQSPGFMIQLLQPEENNWHMAKAGNMLDQRKLDDKPVASDGMIIKYKPPVGEKLKPVVPLYSGFDMQPEPELSNNGLKDFCISPEFLKVLMDEKLSPLDNHSPLLLPDWTDDGSWEQLLLDSPILGNNEDCNHENEGPTVSGVEIEPTAIFETPNEKPETFESLIAEVEKTQKGGLKLCADGIHLEGLQSLESLTEQMELLTPEKDNDEEGRN